MALASIAAATAAAAYIDARYHITKDLAVLGLVSSVRKQYAAAVKSNRLSPWYFFEAEVVKNPDNECIWSRSGSYSWQETYDQACRYGQWLTLQGARPGDLVAVCLQNSPEFLFIWLGLWAIGCSPALINCSLRGDALRHCVRISGARLFIVDEELSPHVSDVSNELKTMLSMVVIFLDRDLKTRINASDPRRPDDDVRSGAKDSDPMALFYTSGTTGMPKAVPFPLSRAFYSGAVRFRLFDIRKGERWYNCMPLYHGTGGVTICACLMTGFPVAIGKRFSASGFWDDVRDSKANCFIYVGETMRYLVASPPTPKDKDHSVRCIYGNGLRPDIWAKVRERFAIADIIEIFNSSEGMLALTNQNKGDFSAYSVGHHGLILRLLNYNSIVPVLASPSTTDLIRDPTTGFATRQPYPTGGEILIRIDSPAAFPGYHNNPVATSAKLERDVFRKGDLYYRTGDALRRDDDGRWYFLDRLGDTFRWKSENVSTTEVAAVLGSFPAVIEANVYGVLVPGHEGRAGCAALFIEHDKRDLFDYAALLAHASANLPLYALPVFIRVVTHMSHIHNLKQDKVQLRRQGINPTEVSLEGDRLLWRPPGGHKTGYVEFGEEDWKAVVAGKARL